jgi:hypothetical protein
MWLVLQVCVSIGGVLQKILKTAYFTTIFEIEFFIGKDKYIHFVEYDNNEIKKLFVKETKT